MKICAAQFKPRSGDIDYNLARHVELIEVAVENNIDLVFFSELSLTGYEPNLAQSLAADSEDERLEILQILSNQHNISIALGLPLKRENRIQISMLFFQPDASRMFYSKQLLHDDEVPYFSPGKTQTYIQLENQNIAPAICFESLQPSHAAKVISDQATVYMVSVAKHKEGLEAAYKYYASLAASSGMIVMLSNSYGPCDDFVSAGSSAVWRSDGVCLAKLGKTESGLVGLDTSNHIPILVHVETNN